MFFPTLLIACEQFVPCAQEKSLSCGVGCATGGLLLGCEGAAGPVSSPAQGRVRQSTLPTATSSWVFNISTDGDRQALWAMYSCVCLLSQDFFFFFNYVWPQFEFFLCWGNSQKNVLYSPIQVFLHIDHIFLSLLQAEHPRSLSLPLVHPALQTFNHLRGPLVVRICLVPGTSELDPNGPSSLEFSDIPSRTDMQTQNLDLSSKQIMLIFSKWVNSYRSTF